MLPAVLTATGGVLLLLGLVLALNASREEARAIKAVEIREDPWGTVKDYGWWHRARSLGRAETRFRVGVALTALGVALQTIGGISSSTR